MAKQFEILTEYQFLNELVQRSQIGIELIPLVGAGISIASGIPAIPQIESYLKSCVMLALRSSQDNGSQAWTPKQQWPDLSFFDSNPSLCPSEPALEELNQSRLWRQGYGDSSDWRRALNFLSRLDCSNGAKELTLVPPQNAVIDSFFRHVTSGKTPNLAHRMLATLSGIGRIRLLMTINFDELIEAAMRESSLQLSTIPLHHNAFLPPLDTFESNLTLLKLHGGQYGLRADDSLDILPSNQELDRFRSYFYRQGGGQNRADLFVAGSSFDDVRMRAFLKSLCFTKMNVESVVPPRIFWVCYSEQDVLTAREIANEFGQRKENETQVFIHRSVDTGLLLFRFYQMLTSSLPTLGAVIATPSLVPWPPGPPLVTLEGSDVAPPTDRDFNYGDLIDFRLDHSDSGTAADGRALFSNARQVLNGELNSLSDKNTFGFISILGREEYQGITAIAGTVYHDRVSKFENTLWFDLDDAGSMDDLYDQIRTAIANRTTAGDWVPSAIPSNEERRAIELARYMRLLPNRWTIFLNAREGAGVNGPDVSGKSRRAFKEDPAIRDDYAGGRKKHRKNGWLDSDLLDPVFFDSDTEQSVPYLSDNWNSFERFIEGLTSVGSGIPATFVLVAHGRYTEGKSVRETYACEQLRTMVPHLRQWVLGKELEEHDENHSSIERRGTPLPDSFSIFELKGSIAYFNEAGIEGKVEEWLTTPESTDEVERSINLDSMRKWRFLSALVLMRHSRHSSALFGYAFRMNLAEAEMYDEKELFGLTEKQEVRAVDDFVSDLEKTGFIRWKPGGFIWLHSGSRDAVKAKLEDWLKEHVWRGGLATPAWSLRWTFAHSHLGIASWYRRVLQSTSDSGTSAIDAVNHLCCAAREFLNLINTSGSESVVEFSYGAALDALLDARRLIRSNRSAISTQHNSTGNCRRLEAMVRDEIGPIINLLLRKSPKRGFWHQKKSLFEAAIRLQHSIYKCMSSTARESGEIARAYIRLRQYVYSKHSEFIQFKSSTNTENDWFGHEESDAAPNPVNSVSFQKVTRSIAGLVHRERSQNALRVSRSPEERENEYNRNMELLNRAPVAWLRYERAIAVLHIASRSYLASQNSLLRCFRQLISNKQLTDVGIDDSTRRELDEVERRKLRELAHGEVLPPTGTIGLLRMNVEETAELCNNLRKRAEQFADSRAAREIVKLAHRQLQLATLIIELIDCKNEIEPSKTSDESDLRGLRESAIKAGQSSYSMAMRIIDHFGAFAFEPEMMDGREGERRRLLDEMQRLETFSSILFTLRGVDSRIKTGSKSESQNYFRLASRAIDHAAAWIKSSPEQQLPLSIVELQKASLSLAYATPVIREHSTIVRGTLTLQAAIKEDLLNKIVCPDNDDYAIELTDGRKPLRKMILDLIVEIQGKEICYPEIQTVEDASLEITRPEKAFNITTGRLETAEQILSRSKAAFALNRRGVWWTGLLLELHLLAFRSHLHIGILAGRGIPSFLRNAICRGWKTPIEQLIVRASQLLRLDSIRFGRCLHLYADCVFAIWVSKYLDRFDMHGKYDFTLREMLNLLGSSQARLDRMSTTKEAREKLHDTVRPNELTKGYVISVHEYCNRVKKAVSVSSHLE